MKSLADRIEDRIRKIPISNNAYISAVPETLDRVLSGDLLRRIAQEAAKEAEHR